MRQVFIFHGGDSFSSYDSYINDLKNRQLDYERMKKRPGWREWLATELTDSDVLFPTMPNSANAVYNEWAIVFKKLTDLFDDDVRLVGLSLGAMFLAKYLNANQLATPVQQLHLLAGAYDIANEDLGSFRIDSAVNLPGEAQQIHLYHSQDDPVVPFSELAKFQKDLPDAVVHTFTDRGHFSDETFPELLKLLKAK